MWRICCASFHLPEFGVAYHIFCVVATWLLRHVSRAGRLEDRYPLVPRKLVESIWGLSRTLDLCAPRRIAER